MKKYNPYSDPAVAELVADIDALYDRARELSQKSDRESPAVGTLWGITTALANASAASERFIPDDLSTDEDDERAAEEADEREIAATDA